MQEHCILINALVATSAQAASIYMNKHLAQQPLTFLQTLKYRKLEAVGRLVSHLLAVDTISFVILIYIVVLRHLVPNIMALSVDKKYDKSNLYGATRDKSKGGSH